MNKRTFLKILRISCRGLFNPFLECSVSKFWHKKPFCRRHPKRDYARINQPGSGYLRSDAIYFCKKNLGSAGLPSQAGAKLTNRRGHSCRNDEERWQDSQQPCCDPEVKATFVFEGGSVLHEFSLIDYQLIKEKTQSRDGLFRYYSHSLCDSGTRKLGLIPFMGETGNWELLIASMWKQVLSNVLWTRKNTYINESQKRWLWLWKPSEFQTLKPEHRVKNSAENLNRYSRRFPALLIYSDFKTHTMSWGYWRRSYKMIEYSTLKLKTVPFPNQSFIFVSVSDCEPGVAMAP